jgi:hypothetical protein
LPGTGRAWSSVSVVKIQRGWGFEVTELMSVHISQGSHLGCPREGEGYLHQWRWKRVSHFHPGDPPPSRPALDHPGAEARRRHLHLNHGLGALSSHGFVNLQRDVQGLRELARAAPGAAVVTAYGYVTAALKELLAEDDDREPEQHDAPALAQAAANHGLVSDQLVDTVYGLTVLKDVGLRGGAGTGLSVEQANEYIDLVSAALYVLHSGRGERRRMDTPN